MLKLIALVEKHLGAQWIDIAEWLRNTPQNSLDEIERRLVAGDIQGVVAEVQSAALKFAAETQHAYVTAGKTGAEWLDGKVPDKLIRFDATGSRALDFARANQLEKIREISQDTRQAVQSIIVDGHTRAENPREIARSIRDSIGLTSNQEQHVRNYRRALETGDYGNAMGRELHDARSDRSLRRGETLPPEQIDRMVERYRTNYVAYRAETIARTEASKNVHAGLEESYTQAIERGDVEADALTKEWIHAGRGSHSRPTHARMDGKSVPFGEDFVLPDGVRMRWPGDPLAPVGELANCRCTFATSLL